MAGYVATGENEDDRQLYFKRRLEIKEREELDEWVREVGRDTIRVSKEVGDELVWGVFPGVAKLENAPSPSWKYMGSACITTCLVTTHTLLKLDIFLA